MMRPIEDVLLRQSDAVPRSIGAKRAALEFRKHGNERPAHAVLKATPPEASARCAMKTFSLPLGLSALAMVLVTGAAVAQQRPYSPDMSCKAIENLVASRGALLIDTGPRSFDRFVNSRQFCYFSQDIEPAWIPAGDDRECFVGYTCKEHDRERSR